MEKIVLLVLGIAVTAGLLRYLRNVGGRSRLDGAKPADTETESHRYAATSIHSYGIGCQAAQEIQGKRFLPTEVPELPLKNCTLEKCNCRYSHHVDRRTGTVDRRLLSGNNQDAHPLSIDDDNRRDTGRRKSDWALA